MFLIKCLRQLFESYLFYCLYASGKLIYLGLLCIAISVESSYFLCNLLVAISNIIFKKISTKSGLIWFLLILVS